MARNGKRRSANGANGHADSASDADDTRDETAASNVGNRQDALADALKRVYAIDTEIGAITEQNIKGLRDDKSDIIQSLRERFNIPAKIFRARYYSYRMERQAAAENDQATLDQIRELYELAPVGKTVDWVEAAGGKVDAQPGA